MAKLLLAAGLLLGVENVVASASSGATSQLFQSGQPCTIYTALGDVAARATCGE